MELTSSRRSRSVGDTVVRAGLVLIILVAAKDELSRAMRRSSRSMAVRWDAIDHRQRRRLRRSQAVYLARRLRAG